MYLVSTMIRAIHRPADPTASVESMRIKQSVPVDPNTLELHLPVDPNVSRVQSVPQIVHASIKSARILVRVIAE